MNATRQVICARWSHRVQGDGPRRLARAGRSSPALRAPTILPRRGICDGRSCSTGSISRARFPDILDRATLDIYGPKFAPLKFFLWRLTPPL